MAVRTATAGPVVTVILSRPERRNAVDRETAQALVEAFEAFECDPEARVAVLWGEGGTFCAGADLVAAAAGLPNRVEREGPGPMGPTRMVLTKPVIAAVAGYAVAGGLELALWCDLRVVEESATFGVYCRRWGVPLIDGGTVRLPRVIGAGARSTWSSRGGPCARTRRSRGASPVESFRSVVRGKRRRRSPPRSRSSPSDACGPIGAA